LSIIAALAVGHKPGRVRLVSETQDLWPAFGRGGKFGADCRACDRLSFPLSGAISTFDHSCRSCHGRGLGSPVFLLPRHRPLGCRTNSRHSLRFLYRRRDWQSRRLARWTPLVVRTSCLFWSADGEGLHADSQPDCQSDYVVCGSDFFRGCPKPGCVLGLALGCPGEQAVSSVCAVLGGWNLSQQLDKPRGRLCQSPAGARQYMILGSLGCAAKYSFLDWGLKRLYTPSRIITSVRA